MESASPRISVSGILKFLATLPMDSVSSSGTASKAVAISLASRVNCLSWSVGTSMRAAAVIILAISVVAIGICPLSSRTSASACRYTAVSWPISSRAPGTWRAMPIMASSCFE